MEKERIRGKDLKKWTEIISDDAYIFVESYDNEHHKEFILAEEYDEKGNNADKELLVISAKKGEILSNENEK